MSSYDVYISYAEEDRKWVDNLVEEIEEDNLLVCLKSRDFNEQLSLEENRKILVEQCSSCILVFSKHYCKRASEWSYFTKFICNQKNEKEKTISRILDNKGIVCVYLSQCTIPNLFIKQKMLDWTEEDLRDLFWERLIKFLKNAQKKSQIRKALASKINSNIVHAQNKLLSSETLNNSNERDTSSLVDQVVESGREETRDDQHKIVEPLDSTNHETEKIFKEHKLEAEPLGNTNYKTEEIIDKQKNIVVEAIGNKNHQTDKNFDEQKLVEPSDYEEPENIGRENSEKVKDYILFNNVYPHLVSSSFNAEDEDLTKDELENLTLKMEDVETIMLLNESNNNDSSAKDKKVDKNMVFEFDSQYEQMQVLDALQTIQERIQKRLDLLPMDKTEYTLLKKKRYRRLLRRFQDCLMKAVNGKKNSMLINSLPFVSDLLEEAADIHGFKCNCCDGLYHSKRALDIHLGFCIKQHWAELIRYLPKK